MMPEYNFIPWKQNGYCFPACLQMVLARRGLAYESQEQILGACGTHLGTEDLIHSYFRKKEIPLLCDSFLLSKLFSRDFPELAEEALQEGCDVLVAYAYDSLHKTESEGDHVSLIKTLLGDAVELVDPANEGSVVVSFADLVSACFVVNNGFHIIHDDQATLDHLRKSYV